jgi:UDP:flavonoid glycosyltransferase YjiC (YdhE family)
MKDTSSDLTAKSILFAWELGANLGHIKPMAALAQALAARGANITFAVRDLTHTREIGAPGAFTVLQAPVWPDHRHSGHRPSVASYADVLTAIGFADHLKLMAVVDAWDAIIKLIRPDLVIADHAPALQVAMVGSPVPIVTVGTPFTLPPLSLGRLPPIRADQAPALPEARLHQAVKTVLVARGVAVPPRLVDLFRSDERLIFGLPELDPYRAYRDEQVLLPPEPVPAFVDPPVRPRLFVYAGSELPHLETLVQTLVSMDVDVSAYLRGDVGPLPHFLKRRGYQVFDSPPPFAEILPRVSHVLSQGGAFTCHAALAAGRPHLVIPLHNETELNFAHVRAMGVAQRLDALDDEKALRKKLAGFLDDATLLAQARHWALTLRAREQKNGLNEAIAAVDRCLRRDQIRNSRLRSAAATAQPS